MSATLAAPPSPRTLPDTTIDLILLRMALPKPTAGDVRKQVGTLLTDQEWTAEQFEVIKEELVAAGWIAKKGKSIFLTEAGRERALKFLDPIPLPTGPKIWQQLKKTLIQKLYGLTPEAMNKLTKGEQWAAYVLIRKYQLPLSPGATLKMAFEAVVCRELGWPEETSLKGLTERVLNKLIGGGEQLPHESLKKQLPFFQTGINANNADLVQKVLLRQALKAPTPVRETREEIVPVPVVEPKPTEEFDLQAFANTVKSLARNCPPEDRFYDNKAYISQVWKASQREGFSFPRMTLPEFKQHLLEANRNLLLTLSCADLVQEMPEHLVAESEIQYLTTTFHFVLIEEARS